MAIDASRQTIPGTTGQLESNDLLEATYRDHGQRLRGRLLAMTRDPAVADDLMAEAFLRLAIELRAGRTPTDPPAWLYRVANNLVMSRGRRSIVARRAMPGLLERGVEPSPEDRVVERERDQLVHEVLDTLSAADREIVVLAARGYRPQEIAGIIGKSAAATRTSLCRARGKIRVGLKLSGMTA